MTPVRPFVRVLGVALTLNGCHKEPPAAPLSSAPPQITPVTNNPPQPEPETNGKPLPEPVPPTYNPPPPTLPRWDDVPSGHPEGATNPPRPILVVAADTGACFKVWHGGMIPPPADVRAAKGRVVATAAEAGERATQVQCPEGQPDTLLKAYAALPADTQKPPL